MSHRKRSKRKKEEEIEESWDAESASNVDSESSSDSDSYSDRDSFADFSSLEIDADEWDFGSEEEWEEESTGITLPGGISASLASIAGKSSSNLTKRRSRETIDNTMFPNLRPSEEICEEKSEKLNMGEDLGQRKSFGLRSSERTSGTPSSTISTLSSTHDGEFPTISTDFQPHIVKIVNFLGITPQILCVGADSVISRYRLDDGQALLPPLLGHRDRVTCLATSNLFQSYATGFGRREVRMVAVSGGRDGEIRLWDLLNGECLTQIVAYSTISPISGLPLLCGSVTVAVRSNGQIQIVSSGGESTIVTRSPHPPPSFDGTTSSRKVLDDVHVWDGVSGRKLRTLHHPRTEEGQQLSAISDSRVTCLLLHQPLAVRSLLFTAGAYPEIFIWDSEEAVLLCILRGHNDIISSIAISSVLPMSMAVSWIGKLSMVDPLGAGDDSIETIHDILSCAPPMDETTMALHPNECMLPSRGSASRREVVLVSSSRDKTVRVWDILKGRTRFVLEQHQAPVQSIATLVSPPGSLNIGGGVPLCISVGDDGLVCAWNLQTGKLVSRATSWHRHSSTVALPSASRSTTSNTAIRSVDVTIVTSATADTPSTWRSSPRSLSTFPSMLNRAADPRQRKVLITTCAWNNSIQCHELNRDLLVVREAPSSSSPSISSTPAATTTPTSMSSALTSRWPVPAAAASCCIS